MAHESLIQQYADAYGSKIDAEFRSVLHGRVNYVGTADEMPENARNISLSRRCEMYQESVPGETVLRVSTDAAIRIAHFVLKRLPNDLAAEIRRVEEAGIHIEDTVGYLEESISNWNSHRRPLLEIIAGGDAPTVPEDVFRANITVLYRMAPQVFSKKAWRAAGARADAVAEENPSYGAMLQKIYSIVNALGGGYIAAASAAAGGRMRVRM